MPPATLTMSKAAKHSNTLPVLPFPDELAIMIPCTIAVYTAFFRILYFTLALYLFDNKFTGPVPV